MLSLNILYKTMSLGGEPLEERVDLLKSSSHFNGKHFHNTLKERDYDIWVNTKDLFGDQKRTPPAPFPLVKPLYNEKFAPGASCRLVWSRKCSHRDRWI